MVSFLSVLFHFTVVWLSEPVQSIAWKGWSSKWPIMNTFITPHRQSDTLHVHLYRVYGWSSARKRTLVHHRAEKIGALSDPALKLCLHWWSCWRADSFLRLMDLRAILCYYYTVESGNRVGWRLMTSNAVAFSTLVRSIASTAPTRPCHVDTTRDLANDDCPDPVLYRDADCFRFTPVHRRLAKHHLPASRTHSVTDTTDFIFLVSHRLTDWQIRPRVSL